ncbi:MAG TPA: Ig-like domain-containing protein, partial [Actinomycetota bacterium]|nr:Ig-like domain-containing protein [Actinomycetota bacterium]
AWQQIGDPSGDSLVPFSSEFDVAAGNAFVAGPISHPYPSANACRTETTLEGQPGAGTAAACTRGPHADEGLGPVKEGSDEVWGPTGGQTGEENPIPEETDKGLWEELMEAGVPIPDNYDTPSYFALEENTRLHLQAFKMGEVVFASCACEAQVDLILNFESRVNEVQGDIWDGYDWTAENVLPQTKEVLPPKLLCDQAEPPAGDWSCTPNPDLPRPRANLPAFTVTDFEYRRMKAQIHNDAAGWDDPENAVAALSEPWDTTQIFGNFTKEELSAEQGYKLAIGVGHATDYNGYTVSYREFQGYDEYRKALTSYGPHTADYMSTRMVQLAAQLNGFAQPGLEQDIARGLPDEARQLAMSTALGATSLAVYEAWQASFPVDKGPVGKPTAQPKDINVFDAATFKWRGGSNATDNPVVTVERLVDGEWVQFADQSGEIQTKLEFPNGVNAFADTYAGQHDWIWTANFEAFDALPADIGSTPEGEYRFVVRGTYRSAPATNGKYTVRSLPFTVSAWDGINVGELSLNEDGSVSFDVDPIEYPTSYVSEFPYIKTEGKTIQDDEVIKGGELGESYCSTCTFRPWASKGEVATATVTVARADGTQTHVTAAKGSDGRWTAPVELFEGDRAFVAQGGVVDNHGEINGQPSNEVQGTRTRPVIQEATQLHLSFVGKGDNRRLMATLKLVDGGERIPSQTIEFFAKGVLIGQDQTNGSGIARLSLSKKLLKPGITFEARFAGNENYLPASATLSS